MVDSNASCQRTIFSGPRNATPCRSTVEAILTLFTTASVLKWPMVPQAKLVKEECWFPDNATPRWEPPHGLSGALNCVWTASQAMALAVPCLHGAGSTPDGDGLGEGLGLGDPVEQVQRYHSGGVGPCWWCTGSLAEHSRRRGRLK